MSHSPKARLRARRFAAGLLAAAMTASCIPAAFAADNDASKSWTFTWFGPSTSETANTVSAPDGIGGKIVMDVLHLERGRQPSTKRAASSSRPTPPTASASITPPSTRPGKISTCRADVTIDYVNPTPDGQEGFALMIRDVIGKTGESASFESTWCRSPAPSCPTTG